MTQQDAAADGGRAPGRKRRDGSARDGDSIQSVDRAVRLLKAFTVSEPEISVTELARRLGLHKSTVSRLLSALERGGLVQQDPGTSRYRLGFHLVELAGRVLTQIDLRQIAQPYLQDIARATEETVNLGVLNGDEVVNIDQIISPRTIRHMGWVGRRNPLHCTAGGRAVLAFLPPAEIDRILDQPLAKMTWRTCTDPAELRQELERTRVRGYSISEEEFEEGLSAVAAPIRDFAGRTVAVLSISGPAFRLSAGKVIAFGALVREGAEMISRQLGFLPAEPSQSDTALAAAT